MLNSSNLLIVFQFASHEHVQLKNIREREASQRFDFKNYWRSAIVTRRLLTATLCALFLLLGANSAFSATNAKQFAELCKSGTPEQVRSAIKSGAKVNTSDENGYTPLMWAAHNNNLGVVRALLEAGADDQSSGPELRRGQISSSARICNLSQERPSRQLAVVPIAEIFGGSRPYVSEGLADAEIDPSSQLRPEDEKRNILAGVVRPRMSRVAAVIGRDD